MSGNNITDIFLNYYPSNYKKNMLEVYSILCMYCIIQLITNIIDLIQKFCLHSRFG